MGFGWVGGWLVGWWPSVLRFICIPYTPQALPAGSEAGGKTGAGGKKKRRAPKDINSLYRIPREEARLLEDRLERWKDDEAERTGMSGWNILSQKQVRACVLRVVCVVCGQVGGRGVVCVGACRTVHA